jgi:hypothetical protein
MSTISHSTQHMLGKLIENQMERVLEVAYSWLKDKKDKKRLIELIGEEYITTR